MIVATNRPVLHFVAVLVLLLARVGAAQPVQVLVFDADPFDAPAARELGSFAAPDWTSAPRGLPGTLSVETERFDPNLGLLPSGRVNLAPVPAGAAFALANQLDTDLSVFAGRGLAAIPVDSDGNGLPDAWELRFFGHLGVDPNADSDTDGFSNLAEYKAGTDPTDPTRRPELPDLIAHWQGDGDVVDGVTGLNGAWVGDAAYSAGRLGSAFRFDGSAYVRVPDAAPFRSLTALTVAAWVNFSLMDGNALPILARPSSVPGVPAYGLELGPQGPRVRITSAAGGTRSDGPVTVPVAGTWYHLAGVWTGTEVRVYVNGAMASNDRIGGGGFGPLDVPAGNDLLLGFDGNTRHFTGLVDDVVLAGRALTDDEIRALATVPAGGWEVEFVVEPPAAGGDAAMLRFALPAVDAGVVLEAVDALGGAWAAVPAKPVELNGRRFLEIALDPAVLARFFRLRR